MGVCGCVAAWDAWHPAQAVARFFCGSWASALAAAHRTPANIGSAAATFLRMRKLSGISFSKLKAKHSLATGIFFAARFRIRFGQRDMDFKVIRFEFQSLL